jgi:hypothetical protein
VVSVGSRVVCHVVFYVEMAKRGILCQSRDQTRNDGLFLNDPNPDRPAQFAPKSLSDPLSLPFPFSNQTSSTATDLLLSFRGRTALTRTLSCTDSPGETAEDRRIERGGAVIGTSVEGGYRVAGGRQDLSRALCRGRGRAH